MSADRGISMKQRYLKHNQKGFTMLNKLYIYICTYDVGLYVIGRNVSRTMNYGKYYIVLKQQC